MIPAAVAIIFFCGGVQFFFLVKSGSWTTPTARQVPVFPLGVPQGCSFREPQFGPASSGLLLLSGQPLRERGNQIIVGQLVVAGGAVSPTYKRRLWLSLCRCLACDFLMLVFLKRNYATARYSLGKLFRISRLSVRVASRGF